MDFSKAVIELGDVAEAIESAINPDGPGGTSITWGEGFELSKETVDIVPYIGQYKAFLDAGKSLTAEQRLEEIERIKAETNFKNQFAERRFDATLDFLNAGYTYISTMAQISRDAKADQSGEA